MSEVNSLQLSSAIRTLELLKTLNIKFDGFFISPQDSSLQCYKLINDELKNSNLFFTGINAKDICTMGLAIYQEHSNNFIDNYYIEFVNTLFSDYFESPITYNDIQYFSSKFI
jgi:hypothetical protein